MERVECHPTRQLFARYVLLTIAYIREAIWISLSIRNAKGILEYRSLAQELDIELIEDEQFWNIIPLNDSISFQSLDRIYSYNTSNKKLNTMTPIVLQIRFSRLRM